jgi:hypothetical protein
MSTFEMKKKLKAEIAAAKKAGKSMQTVGKLQYKLNQISKDSKGTPVKSKTGVVKSKTGVVRQKAGKKKAGPDMYKDAVALDKTKGKVTVTGLNGKSRKVKAGSADKVITPIQKKNDKGLEKPKPSRMVRKGKGHPSAEMFAYVQNIDKKPSVKKKK